jgi:hypothetical protein
LSAFHQPPPVRSLLDPWWLAGLAVLVLVGGRALVALRARSEETAFWVWAAVSYLPVSQIFPFPFPLADRYLYPILPGLIGGTLLAARSLAVRLPPLPAAAFRAAAVASCILLLGLGTRAFERARLWGSPALLLADAARRYPDGSVAHLQRARGALLLLDQDRALAELRSAFERGFDRYDQLLADPSWQTLAGDPRYQALLAEMGARWIERLQAVANPTQIQLYNLAMAFSLRGDLQTTRRYLEAARERGGAFDAEIDRELRLLAARPE